mmetsp:Transcript_119713/g.343944  ORF Transcript_119713/g.343944 Transcript_119713/m.343944 type:complete len:108 (-) Transcript_119713:363-686(-)
MYRLGFLYISCICIGCSRIIDRFGECWLVCRILSSRFFRFGILPFVLFSLFIPVGTTRKWCQFLLFIFVFCLLIQCLYEQQDRCPLFAAKDVAFTDGNACHSSMIIV